MTIVGGVPVETETTRLDNSIIMTVQDTKAVLLAITSTGDKIPLSADGALLLQEGAGVDASFEGLLPGANVEGWMYSTPVRLGAVSANDAGRVQHRFVVPSGLEPGNHRLVFSATDPEGEPMVMTLGVTIEDDGDSFNVGMLVLLVVGLGAVAALFLPAALRRREASAQD